jgi:DNA-binding response OmpR family regulator
MDRLSEISREAKILVIEDDAQTIQDSTGMLSGAGYLKVWTTEDPRAGLEAFRRVHPDLVLVDLESPHDLLEVLRQMHEEIPSEEYLPIVVISRDTSEEAKLNALLLGAKDFIAKPVDAVETMLRIRIRLETRFRFVQMQRTIERLRGPYGWP